MIVNNQALSELGFFLAARRSDHALINRVIWHWGKVIKNACAITIWILGFGLCKQFAKFCFVFGV